LRFPFDLSQQRHDLFCFVPLDGHDQPSSSEVILSHFGWYKNPRSGQLRARADAAAAVPAVEFGEYVTTASRRIYAAFSEL
jgi:hypothetical protein